MIMRKKPQFNGWEEGASRKSKSEVYQKLINKLENEIKDHTVIVEEVKSSIYDLIVNEYLRLRIQEYIDSLPSFTTTDLEKAAEFISEYMCYDEEIDCSTLSISDIHTVSEELITEKRDNYLFNELSSNIEENFHMRRKKKVSGHVKKLGRSGKEINFEYSNLSFQPIVQLTKLKIPELFKKGNASNFSINVNSISFKKLINDLNNHQNILKSMKKRNTCHSSTKSKSNSVLINKTNKYVPMFMEHENRMLFDESVGEPNTSNDDSRDLNQSGEKENQCSDIKSSEIQEFGLEDNNLPTNNETENITRTDKVIDTFLHVMRKTTDDNTILSALQRDYICAHCQQGFLKKGSLRKHMWICSLGKRGKKPRRNKKDRSFSCPLCGIIYKYKYSLDKHNANVHNLKKMYKCLVCSEHFYNEDALTLHCRSRHGLGGSNIYKCPYCEASFNFRNDLNYHCRKAHNTTKYFVCSQCLECFKNEDTCKLHERSHGYCCDICMLKTKSEGELISHRLTHLYMVIHKCDKCSRTFKAKRDFTKHIKVHEREKNREESVP